MMASAAIEGAVVRHKDQLGGALFWTVLSSVLYLGSQWAIVTMVARMGSVSMVGQLAYAFAVTAPLFLLSNLRLRSVLATDAGAQHSLTHYGAVRIVATALAVLACLAVAAADLNNVSAMMVLVAVALFKAFESGSDLLYGFFQRSGEWRQMSQSMSARAAASALIVALTMFFTRSVVATSFAMAATGLLFLSMVDLPLAFRVLRCDRTALWRKNVRQTDLSALKRLSLATLPLGMSAMLMSLGANLPRLIIHHFGGDRELGVYSVVWYMAAATGYLASAIGEAIGPKLGQLWSTGEYSAFGALGRKYLALSAAPAVFVLLLAIASGSGLLTSVYGPEYRNAGRLFLWLAVAGVVSNTASLLSYVMIAMRCFRQQFVSLLLATGTILFGCWALFPRFGTVGAAWALLLAYGFQTVFGFVVMSRRGQQV